MGKKRKSRGRSKGSKGRGDLIQCSKCGAMVPKDKAKRIFTRPSFIDSRLAYELRKQGAYIPGSQILQYVCISCAVSRGYYHPRAENERRKPYQKRRY